MPNPSLNALPTPCLLVDEARMQANIDAMNAQLQRLGVPLRPHLKTCKNIEIARAMLAGHPGAAAVSTLAEADYFFRHGITDLLYAVGIAPGKLAAVAERIEAGMDLTIILDQAATANAVVSAGRQLGCRFRVMLEIDADGARAGFRPDDPDLVSTARKLVEAGADLAGVMVHAGGSYGCSSRQAIVDMAATERRAAVTAAERLGAHGLQCRQVSVGSTPTALRAQDLAGVTEVRAGVYIFQDLVMAGLGICTESEIAVSVLTEVIGHRKAQGQVLVDAGWMALSRDRGTASQARDRGYGLVRDLDGSDLGEVIVQATNQEHGILAGPDNAAVRLADFPVGRRLRILPNHACATAAQHAHYWLLDNQEPARLLRRCNGW